MLKIRLSRTGKNSQPSFRVVVQEHTDPVKGKPLEALGFYKPARNPKEFSVNLDRIKHWLSVGAQPSDAMAVLLKQEGIDNMEKFIAPRDKQKKKKKAVEEKMEAPASVAPAPAPAPVEPKAEESVAEAVAAEEAPVEEAPVEEVAVAEEEPAAEEVVAASPMEAPASVAPAPESSSEEATA